MKRKLFYNLVKHLSNKEFTIVTGARQTGKSTLLGQLEQYCKEQQIPVVKINLEHKDVLTDLNQSPLHLFHYLPANNEKIVVLLDEVQYLDDPSHFLKLLYDEYAEKIKIVATGSSAFYIDDKFTDSLSGRKKIFHLFTCSFDEYLLLSNQEDLRDEYWRIKSNPSAKSLVILQLQNAFEQYMTYGGYPAVITEPDTEEKVARLRELRDSFIKRDILESGVKNEKAFYNLFRLLAGQTGNLVNVNELSITLGIKHDTLSRYLLILQKCFHITLVKPFSRNLRNEIVKMPKVYLMDLGMRNLLLSNFNSIAFREDKGEIWENLYFRLLCEIYPLENIYFWRTVSRNEVDFIIIPDNGKMFAIETKYNSHQIKPKKYEIFAKNYPGIALSYACFHPFDENIFRMEN